MEVCLVPGSFDPITSGHADIIRRARSICPRVVVGVLANKDKRGTFPVERRLEWIRRVFADDPGVEVRAFEGLTVDLAREVGAQALIRGLRSGADYEYETAMATMNRHLARDVETLFLCSASELSMVSSSLVCQVGALGGEIRGLVPDAIYEDVLSALRDKKEDAR